MTMPMPMPMPEPPMPAQGSLSGHMVDALSAGTEAVVWDRELTGFVVHLFPIPEAF